MASDDTDCECAPGNVPGLFPLSKVIVTRKLATVYLRFTKFKE